MKTPHRHWELAMNGAIRSSPNALDAAWSTTKDSAWDTAWVAVWRATRGAAWGTAFNNTWNSWDAIWSVN